MSTLGNRDRSGNCKLVFPFHYGSESESYAFYRVPKALFESEVFRPLSTDAKLLYGLLNDRMDLSRKNGWVDEEGKVYIYFTRQSVMEALDCGNKKAGQLFAELDDKNGIGLITRTRQGLGKPDRIYVHKCVIPELPIRGSPSREGNGDWMERDAGEAEEQLPAPFEGPDFSSQAEITLPEVSKSHFQRCRNDTSGEAENTRPEVLKMPPNHTDKNNTEMSETYPIRSNPETDGYDRSDADMLLSEYREYQEYFDQACCVDYLRRENPMSEDIIGEILQLLTETCCSRKQVIRVGGEDKPAQIVKARLMKLDSGHIQYVLNCFRENTTKVRNIRQYLLTALFNAPATIGSYYAAEANYDMYGQQLAQNGARQADDR